MQAGSDEGSFDFGDDLDDEGADEGDDGNQGALKRTLIANKGASGLYRVIYSPEQLGRLMQRVAAMPGLVQGAATDIPLDLTALMDVSRVLQDAFEVSSMQMSSVVNPNLL